MVQFVDFVKFLKKKNCYEAFVKNHKDFMCRDREKHYSGLDSFYREKKLRNLQEIFNYFQEETVLNCFFMFTNPQGYKFWDAVDKEWKEEYKRLTEINS